MTVGTTYSPRPGTVAYRALSWLQTQPEGFACTLGCITDALGLSGQQLFPCLQPAVEAGLLERFTKHGATRPYFYRLPKPHDSSTATESAAYGSQKPDGGQASHPFAKAGSDTPQGTNRDASTGQSHEAGTECASSSGRGVNDASARAAVPNASPGGGPTGAGQPAAAGPAVGRRTLRGVNAYRSLSGEASFEAEDGTVIVFEAEDASRLPALFARALP